MQNLGLYYKQDNWEADQYTIKGFFSGGTWVINPYDIEYMQQNNIAPHGNVTMYDIFIKTRNMPQPYFIGRYQAGTYSMRDALASYASIHNLQFSYGNITDYTTQNTYNPAPQYNQNQGQYIPNAGYQQYNQQQRNYQQIGQQNMYNQSAYNYKKPKKRTGRTAALTFGVILVVVVGVIILVNTKNIIFALIGGGLAGAISLFSAVFGNRGRGSGGYYNNDYYDSRQMDSWNYSGTDGHGESHGSFDSDDGYDGGDSDGDYGSDD